MTSITCYNNALTVQCTMNDGREQLLVPGQDTVLSSARLCFPFIW